TAVPVDDKAQRDENLRRLFAFPDREPGKAEPPPPPERLVETGADPLLPLVIAKATPLRHCGAFVATTILPPRHCEARGDAD
ncbi:MAG: hypothetical protein LBE06_07325, partial [Azoarcus sp.]|nr:hypothetical protein [Azoarcus sp.]